MSRFKYLLKKFVIFELLFGSESTEDSGNCIYSKDWKEKIEFMGDLQFNDTFRMNKACFGQLKAFLSTHSSKPEYLELKLYVFLYFVGHGITYRSLRKMFGLSHTWLFKMVEEMAVFLSKVAKEEIKFPIPEEYESLKSEFEKYGSVRGAILSIDGTHVYINKPTNDHPFDYYNRKMRFSISFICCVDPHLRFRAITYGFGRSHDAGLLKNSKIVELIENINDPHVMS